MTALHAGLIFAFYYLPARCGQVVVLMLLNGRKCVSGSLLRTRLAHPLAPIILLKDLL